MNTNKSGGLILAAARIFSFYPHALPLSVFDMAGLDIQY